VTTARPAAGWAHRLPARPGDEVRALPDPDRGALEGEARPAESPPRPRDLPLRRAAERIEGIEKRHGLTVDIRDDPRLRREDIRTSSPGPGRTSRTNSGLTLTRDSVNVSFLPRRLTNGGFVHAIVEFRGASIASNRVTRCSSAPRGGAGQPDRSRSGPPDPRRSRRHRRPAECRGGARRRGRRPAPARPKIIVGKYKRRKDYRRRNGYRDDVTEIEIAGIHA